MAAIKGTIQLEDQEKSKDRKTQKSMSEEKVVGFSSASLFPTRKWEAVTQGGTMEPFRPIDGENPGSQYHQRQTGKTSETICSQDILK